MESGFDEIADASARCKKGGMSTNKNNSPTAPWGQIGECRKDKKRKT